VCSLEDTGGPGGGCALEGQCIAGMIPGRYEAMEAVVTSRGSVWPRGLLEDRAGRCVLPGRLYCREFRRRIQEATEVGVT
jgi:hypothetical protein